MRGAGGMVVAAFGAVALAGTAKADGPLVAPPASWATSFSVDAVYATRGSLPNDTMIENHDTGAPLLSSGNFGFSWAPGADVQFNATAGKVDFDARFLGGFDFTSSQTLTAPSAFAIPTIPRLGADSAEKIDANYSTKFNSAELNVGHDFSGRFTGFAGARAVWIDDELALPTTFTGNSADILWDVDTFGVGPQVGGTWHLVKQGELTGPLNALGVVLDGRVGYLWTSSDAKFSVTQNVGSAFRAASSFGGGTAIAEGGIKLLFRLWRNLDFEAGYRVVYLDAVPSAAGSIRETNVDKETVGKSTDPLLIQGGTLGIRAHF